MSAPLDRGCKLSLPSTVYFILSYYSIRTFYYGTSVQLPKSGNLILRQQYDLYSRANPFWEMSYPLFPSFFLLWFACLFLRCWPWTQSSGMLGKHSTSELYPGPVWLSFCPLSLAVVCLQLEGCRFLSFIHLLCLKISSQWFFFLNHRTSVHFTLSMISF